MRSKRRRRGTYLIIAGLMIGILVLTACTMTAGETDLETEEPTELPAVEEETEEPTEEPTEPMDEPTEEPMEEPTEAAAEGEEIEVAMVNTTYDPEEITIAPGTTVTWVNEDSFAHTVTSGTRDNPTDMFDENVPAGGSFSFTFEEPGTYDYYCTIHPGMNGVVIVEE